MNHVLDTLHAARYTEYNDGKYLNQTYTEEDYVRGFKLTAAKFTMRRDNLATMIAFSWKY